MLFRLDTFPLALRRASLASQISIDAPIFASRISG